MHTWVDELASGWDEYLSLGIKAAAVLLGGFLAAKVAAKLIKEAGQRAGVEETVVGFFASVTKLLIYVATVSMALSTLHFDTSSIVAGTAAFSFALGFAMQQTLSNLAAGLMVAVYRPFRKGDFVEVSGFTGLVERVTAADTLLTTREGNTIWLPNSKIWGNPVKNMTLGLEEVDLRVEVGGRPGVGAVRERVSAALRGLAGVMPTPEPLVLMWETVEVTKLRVVCWVDPSDGEKVTETLRTRLSRELSQFGEISFPE